MKCLCAIAAAILCLAAGPAEACTGVAVSDGAQVLVGNNEDWFNPFTRVWFIQPGNGRYGAVCFGFDDGRIQGGMNEKGLFFDAFALAERAVGGQDGKPRFKGYLFKEALLTCATVAEALALLNRYSLAFMSRFQVLLADAGGDAAIVEGEAVIRKEGPFLVVTNFRQSETRAGQVTCPRYRIASDLLAEGRNIDRGRVRRILAATHSEGDFPTVYSNIYDLQAKRVHIYHFHNFEEEVVIDLAGELKRGTGVRRLRTLFGPNDAAERFESQYTELTQVYTHESPPRFTVRYPSVCAIDDEILQPGQVLMATGRYGKVPAISVSVDTVPPAVSLSQVGSLLVAPRLRRMGTRVKIVSSSPARLTDGTEVYESRFTWRWQKRYHVNTLVLSAVREGFLVNVALHHTGDLDHLKHIPYSLAFSVPR